jgi:signal transduction histidine kinase
VTTPAIADRLAAFPSLTAGIAHEITNPLAVIVTSAAMMGDDLAAMLAELDPAGPLHPRIAALLEAQREVAAAAERLQAVAVELRAM